MELCSIHESLLDVLGQLGQKSLIGTGDSVVDGTIGDWGVVDGNGQMMHHVETSDFVGDGVSKTDDSVVGDEEFVDRFLHED